MASPPQRRWHAYAIALGATLVTVLALRDALGWHRRPYPTVLVDPDLAVSDIGLPGWDVFRLRLAWPQRIVEADGQDLTAPTGEYAARAWDQAVARAAAEGRSRMHVRVEEGAGTREADLGIVPLDPLFWWLWAGGLFLPAWVYVGAALIAIGAKPDGKLARTFAATAGLAALYLLTYFDYQTTRTPLLVLLFDVAFAMAPMAFVALALRLPDDVALLERRPWVGPAIQWSGAPLAVSLVTVHLVGGSTIALRQVTTVLLGLGLLFFAGTLLVRWRLARGDRRKSLSALLRGVLVPHLVVGVGLFLATLQLSFATVALFMVPALALAPFASILAFIRYDLFGSRALLSRPLTRVVISATMCVTAIAVVTALGAQRGLPLQAGLAMTAAGAVVATLFVVLALGAGDRKLFPSRAQYKPTIQELSEELTMIHDVAQIRAAVERTVRTWLPCEQVAFVPVSVEPSPPTDDITPVSGARWVAEVLAAPGASAEAAALDRSIPVTFRGELLAELRLGSKHGKELFTSEDEALLKTIAKLAAVALAYARVYAELEEARKEQAIAHAHEKEALLATVGAEVAHEVRYPINYFRSIFKRGARGSQLDAEEIDMGCEEVDRLERLVSRLKPSSASARVERRPLPIADLVTKVDKLLRDRLAFRGLDVRVDEALAITCDPDQVTQVVVNLVSNALEAAGDRGEVGIEWRRTGPGGDLVVWDTGPGFGDHEGNLFTLGYTTKPRGTGIGLAVTQRFVRAHGWTIRAHRGGGRTRFIIGIPAVDIVSTAPIAAE